MPLFHLFEQSVHSMDYCILNPFFPLLSCLLPLHPCLSLSSSPYVINLIYFLPLFFLFSQVADSILLLFILFDQSNALKKSDEKKKGSKACGSLSLLLIYI